MTVEEIRARALELSKDERELLGIELLSSLESPEHHIELNAEWAQEILARSDSYRNGSVQALDSAGTVDRIKQKLAENTRPAYGT